MLLLNELARIELDYCIQQYKQMQEPPVNLGLCGQSIIKAANITKVIVDGVIANSEMGK